MAKRLLVASHREEDIEFGKKVAEKAGFDFILAKDTEEIKNALLHHQETVAFWDIDSETIEELKNPLSLHVVPVVLETYLKARHIFGMASSSVFDLPKSRRLDGIGNFCIRRATPFGVDWAAKLVTSVFKTDPPGLQHYTDDGVTLKTIELSNASEKKEVVDKVEEKLKLRGMDTRAIQMVVGAVDELLMNAIFDAPINDGSKRYRREFSRQEPLDLSGKEKVTLSFAFNEEWAAVSVRDQFGSFVATRALEVIRKDYSAQGYDPKASTKAAGLGLRGMISNGMSLAISCKLGISTEAIIAFPYYRNFKDTRDTFRSFSFNVRI